MTEPSLVVLALALLAPRMAQAEDGGRGALTRPQLDAFARVVGDDTDVVAQRLASDPGLLPLAAAAADARLARRHSGATLTTAGFLVLGVGLLGGGVLIVSGLTPSGCGWEEPNCGGGDNDGTVHAGFAALLVGLVAGPALAIPGLVKLARTTQVEADALERYGAPPLARPFA